MKLSAYRPRVALMAMISAGACTMAVMLPQTALAQDVTVASEPAAIVQTNGETDDVPETAEPAAAAPVADAAPSAVSPTQGSPAAAVPTEGEAAQSGSSASTSGAPAEAAPAENGTTPQADATQKDATAGQKAAEASNEVAPAEETPAEEEPAEPAHPHDVADGSYVIESGVADNQVMDVSANGNTPGSNVQSYSFNGSAAQKWDITYDSDAKGYYVAKHGTDLVLEAQREVAANGVNVALGRKRKGLAAQLWDIQMNGNAYTFISHLDSDYVIDLYGAGTRNGTNVQIYKGNGTAAQRFYLLAINPTVESNVELEDGTYSIKAVIGKNKSVDISSGSWNTGANAQIWDSNGTGAQRFYLHRGKDGLYTIAVVGTGMVLDLSSAQFMPGGNVQQWSYNGTDAQKWAIRQNEDGTYSFVNKANGLTLDIAGANANNGGNLNTYRANGTKAQRFTLQRTQAYADGIYSIRNFNARNSKTFDIASGSNKSGAQAQLYAINDTLAQRFQVVNNEDGTISIRTAASGGWLTRGSNGLVVQEGSSKTELNDAQKWYLGWNGSYFSLVNKGATEAADGQSIVLDIEGASTANGAKVQTYAANGSDAQHFLFATAQLIKNGVYRIASALGLTLDVAGASGASGANIQGYANNNSIAQKFYISHGGNGYVISNVASGKVLDVLNGSTADGANVQQWDKNGTAAQAWDIQIADGGRVIILNRKSGKALTLTGSTNSSNVEQATADGSQGQDWQLVAATVNAWYANSGVYYYYDGQGSRTQWSYAAYRAWQKVNSLGSTSRYIIAVDNTNCHTVVFQGSKGAWAPLFDWVCGVGNDRLGRTYRGITHVSDRGYVMGNDPDYYYWVTFYPNKLGGQRFHSIAYYRNKSRTPGAVYDGRLGAKITHGCVRLALQNTRWIYYNVPNGTTVYLYD